MTPLKPNGKNGDQLTGLIWEEPTAIKMITVTSLINTMMVVKRALSLMPMISMAVNKSTTSIAGRFMSAPGTVPGAFEHQTGMVTPAACMILTK